MRRTLGCMTCLSEIFLASNLTYRWLLAMMWRWQPLASMCMERAKDTRILPAFFSVLALALVLSRMVACIRALPEQQAKSDIWCFKPGDAYADVVVVVVWKLMP